MDTNTKILITGGCGYIGSHTAIDLLEKGFDVISVDNLSRSASDIPERIKKVTGKEFVNYKIDCRDLPKMRAVLAAHPDVKGIIHFAAFKSVGESVKNPLIYYDNNLNSTIILLRLVAEFSIENFVFSSSCSVYGNTDALPVTEESPLAEPESPYGRTKLIAESIIREYSMNSPINFILLRYFNPVGAHESGMIGEIPFGVPDNIVPALVETATGKRNEFIVYGTDYPTRDGSCIRDYIHVMDIADAHTKALQYLIEKRNASRCEVFNLGTGTGVSVLELIHAFEKASGKKLNYKTGNRREGDIVAVYADNKKAKEYLRWECGRNIDDMMRTAWNWELELEKEKGD